MRKLFAIACISMVFAACSSADKQESAQNSKSEVKVQSKAEQASKDNTLKCKLKDDIRIVKLSKESEVKLCEIHYTKEGSKERIASAERQADFCSNVLNNVKKNLTDAGFNCSM